MPFAPSLELADLLSAFDVVFTIVIANSTVAEREKGAQSRAKVPVGSLARGNRNGEVLARVLRALSPPSEVMGW